MRRSLAYVAAGIAQVCAGLTLVLPWQMAAAITLGAAGLLTVTHGLTRDDGRPAGDNTARRAAATQE